MPVEPIEMRLEVKDLEKGLYNLFTSLDKSLHDEIKNVAEALSISLPDKVRETFKAKGARGGRDPWLIVFNPNPLIDTKVLYRSIEGAVVEEDKMYVVYVGTDVPYAKVLNEGGIVDSDVIWIGEGPGKNWKHLGGQGVETEIPARPFLFLTDEDVLEVEDRVEAGIDGLEILKGL